MGIKSAIKRQRVGSRVELKTIKKDDDSPYWVIPQKLDVATNDEIQAEALSSRELLESLAGTGEEPSQEQVMALAKTVDAEQFKAIRRMYTLRLRKGIAEHNLDDDDGNGIPGMPDDLVEAILELPELADEIHGIIVEYNRPLARRSETS